MGLTFGNKKEYSAEAKPKYSVLKKKDLKKVEQQFRPLNKGKFRIQHFIEIQITQHKEIEAPSYFYYPTIEEEDKINASKKTYLEGLRF